MKEVPADKKKSLGKLPTPVRNKMGFMKNGGKVKGYKPGGTVEKDSPEDKVKKEFLDTNPLFKLEDKFKKHLKEKLDKKEKKDYLNGVYKRGEKIYKAVIVTGKHP